MEQEKKDTEKESVSPNAEGINSWNDRLDENLEPEQTADLDADEKARNYSATEGSGDQSDQA